MSWLFELRGKLEPAQRIILEIVGVLLILLLWTVLSEVFSRERISLIDLENEPEVQMTDDRFYENDSLMVAHMPDLIELEPKELEAYGLRRDKVYSILPSPLAVLKSFKELHYDDFLIVNAAKSIWLNFLGYIMAILIALPVGFGIGLIPLFRGLFSRIFDAFRFIPLTAVTGIFVMWLGLGSEMKVAFLAFGILVYLIPVVVQRIDEVDNVYLKTAFTLGATDWQTIRTVYFPAVISKLFDDIRVLVAISWTYITIAEMLNKSGGIGELIWVAKRQSRMDKAFAVLIVIILIGFIQDKIFVALDRMLFPHKHVNTGKKHG